MEWSPIVGLPEPPSILLIEANAYYTGKAYDYGAGEVSYRVDDLGNLYTHYIWPEHASSTDTGNAFGTHTTPRKTVPNTGPLYGYTFPPGSIIFLRGTVTGAQANIQPIGYWPSSGSAEKPLFIRADATARATIVPGAGLPGTLAFATSYIIFENIDWDRGTSDTSAFSSKRDASYSHIAIRNCTIYNGKYIPYQSWQLLRIYQDPGYGAENILINNCTFHDVSHGRPAGSVGLYDAVCINFDAGVESVWITNNLFYNIGSDAVQIACDQYNKHADNSIVVQPSYIYVGKNRGYSFGENLLDLKMCHDVIVSQNQLYSVPGTAYEGHGSYRDGIGDDDGYTYAKHHIWFLLNSARDVHGGFLSFEHADQTWAQDIYYIGNVAFNIHDSTSGEGYGFASYAGIESAYYLNNTAYNCDSPFYHAGDLAATPYNTNAGLVCVNNIFGGSNGIDDPGASPYATILVARQSEIDDRWVMHDNLWYDTNPYRVGVKAETGPSISYTDHATFAAFAAAQPGLVAGTSHADPLFVNSSQGDLRLFASSPAIDAGVSSELEDAFSVFYDRYGIDISGADIAGTTRLLGSGYDLGAYEYALVEQTARPNGDVTTGAWVAVPSGSLYAKLDETTPDDADYIYTRNAASACEMTLSSLTAPGGPATYEFSYRGRGAYTVYLKQGASTTIASWTENDAVYTTHTRTLTAGQAALITDPSTLRVRIVSA